ncbi:MAG: ABC transporter ATP-binding protein [Chitinophagaceae bacterium]
MQPLLEIKNLSVDFIADEITHAVKNISFSVNRGEIVAIVGESGSGKTVTSLSILQLIPAPPVQYSAGEILFSEDGENRLNILQANKKQLQAIRGNKIGMIFQEPMSSLNPVFTCGHQVTEAIRAHKKVSLAKAKQLAIEWFNGVRLPNPHMICDRYPHQLSGGQKQRVMIAMAMCCNPSLLICDEPTTALDVTVQKTILELIKSIQQERNIGVIFITHDLGVVAEIADRAVVMYQGEIVEQNNVQQIFSNPQHPYTKALIACRPVNHKRGEKLPVVADYLQSEKELIFSDNFNADKKADKHLISNTGSGEKILEVKDLSVWFPVKKNLFGKALQHTKAVDDVSFEVYKGETLGLVGESGCGKTTLGRAILRLLEPTAGKIIFNGEDLSAKKSDEIKSIRQQIQIVFQDPYSSLNPRISIGSAIAEPMQVHSLLKTEKERRAAVAELLKKVDLAPAHYNRYPHQFSGGQRQRIVIARALSLNPSFLVCDESVSALDVSIQAQILNLLNDLKKQFGFTIIFISHDLSVVHYLSDRIVVMNRGKIEEMGLADEIYYHPRKEYTRRLIASIPGGKRA